MRRDYNCERVCPRADIEQRRSGTLPENKRAGRLFTMCYIKTHMAGTRSIATTQTVGVRELRQNLSRYLARVKHGETLPSPSVDMRSHGSCPRMQA